MRAELYGGRYAQTAVRMLRICVMSEFEHIPFAQIRGIHMFLNTVVYRKPHFHSGIELIYVLSGNMMTNVEYMTYQLKARDMILINSGSPHEFIAAVSGCLFLCVQVSMGACLTNGQSIRFDSNTPVDFFAPEEYRQFEKLLVNMADKYFRQGRFYELYCTSVTQQLLYMLLTSVPFHSLSSRYASSQEAMAGRLMRMVDYVDKNYSHRLSLAEFARAEGKSLSYISHFIKKSINQTFQNYVNTVRFYAACRLIAANSMNLLDVCYEVGFSDYKYFSQVFKERTGLTPAQYGKKIGAENGCVKPNYDNEHIHTNEESRTIFDALIKNGTLEL